MSENQSRPCFCQDFTFSTNEAWILGAHWLREDRYEQEKDLAGDRAAQEQMVVDVKLLTDVIERKVKNAAGSESVIPLADVLAILEEARGFKVNRVRFNDFSRTATV